MDGGTENLFMLQDFVFIAIAFLLLFNYIKRGKGTVDLTFLFCYDTNGRLDAYRDL